MRAWGLLLLLAAGGSQAADFGSAGTAGLDSLKIPLSTRASGMGGALSAQADDLSAMELNPAGLALMEGLVLGGGHLAHLEGISMDHVGLGWGGALGGMGLLFQSLSSPEIEGLDALGRPTAPFSQRDMAITLGAALGVGRFRAGLAGRMMNRSLAGLTSSGFSGDFGLGLDLGAGLSASLVAANMGSLSALEAQADPTPLSFRAGLGWKGSFSPSTSFIFEADAAQPWDSAIQVRAGAELDYASRFFARLGAQWSEAYDSRQSFSAGLGARLGGLQLDYSYVPYSILGTAHRFSLTALVSKIFNLPGAAGPPSAPLNLAAKLASNAMEASWDPPSEGEPTGYLVYVRKGAGAPFKQVTPKPLTKRRLLLRGISPEKDYGLEVAGVDARGRVGERSQELVLRSGARPRTQAAPAAPKELKARRQGRFVLLSWKAPAGPPARYRVYHSTRDHAGYRPLKGGETSSLEFAVERAALPGKWAYFVVMALGEGPDALESAFSAEAALELK